MDTVTTSVSGNSAAESGISPTAIEAANGMFTITDANGNTMRVDLGTLMMMINLETTKNLDQQIALKLEEMQARNDLISTYTELMSACRKLKAEGKDDGYGNKASDNYDTQGKKAVPITINGVTKNLCGPDSWCEELGLADDWIDIISERDDSKDSEDEWDSKWDANIELISSKIDLLNNDSQMDNIELQNLLDKRNNAFEMATQVMNTNNDSVESTVRNL